MTYNFFTGGTGTIDKFFFISRIDIFENEWNRVCDWLAESQQVIRFLITFVNHLKRRIFAFRFFRFKIDNFSWNTTNKLYYCKIILDFAFETLLWAQFWHFLKLQKQFYSKEPKSFLSCRLQLPDTIPNIEQITEFLDISQVQNISDPVISWKSENSNFSRPLTANLQCQFSHNFWGMVITFEF